MSLTYGFYNSIGGDRKYNALQMSSIFDGIIEDGVYMTIGDALAVKQSSGMTVTIGEGRAWFDHTWTLNDSLYPITLDASDVLLSRIDAIVLEVNANTTTRANSFKIVKGAPASNPVRPTLVKSELLNQHPLAYISVPKGATSISQSNITNAVGTSECPFVTGVLEGMNIDNLVAQWGAQWAEWISSNTSEFESWFQEMKDQLSTDAAGNLQTQVNELKTDKAPVNHASADTTYGVGDGSKFGHVKLSDSVDASMTIPAGIAATPSSVYLAYNRGTEGVNKANAAQSTANAAMPKAGGTFTGNVAARSANTAGAYIRNIRVQDGPGNQFNTNFIIMVRK